jgi:hypothetical protein
MPEQVLAINRKMVNKKVFIYFTYNFLAINASVFLEVKTRAGRYHRPLCVFDLLCDYYKLIATVFSHGGLVASLNCRLFFTVADC